MKAGCCESFPTGHWIATRRSELSGPSFGTRNDGTGQFCVYGLLPDGSPSAPVSAVKADANRYEVALSWAAREGALTYRVKAAKGDSEAFDTIAAGLTTPHFTDRNVSRGATYRYVVTAVSSNGESAPSDSITVVVPRGRTLAVMH